MGYRYLEGITAEMGFEAFGRTKEEMFESAILAISGIMARNVGPATERTVEIDCMDDILCLFDLMNEIIYLKDTQGFVVAEADVSMEGKRLVARLKGDFLENTEPGMDVKSCTLHRMKIWNDGMWRCVVIVDV